MTMNQTRMINNINIPDCSTVLFKSNRTGTQINKGLIIYQNKSIYLCHNLNSYDGGRPSPMPLGYSYSWSLGVTSSGRITDGFIITELVDNGFDYDKINGYIAEYGHNGLYNIFNLEKKLLFSVKIQQFNHCCGSYVHIIRNVDFDKIQELKIKSFSEILIDSILKINSPGLFSKDKQAMNTTIILTKKLTPLLDKDKFILVSSDKETDILINKETYVR